MIKVTKKFLDKKSFLELKNNFYCGYFPWYKSSVLESSSNEGKMHYKNLQFVHIFYSDFKVSSSYFNILDKLLLKINPISIFKIKINSLTRTNEKIVHGMHTDSSYKNIIHTTGIYYLNNNNGETIFEDGTVVKSIENTLVEFPNYLKHSGTTNTCDASCRLVLNLNYLKDKTYK